MSVILDIDLDYFGLFEQPIAELERLLTWAGRPVDFVVEHHHEAYTRWKQMVTVHLLQPPHLIIHADEHHDMMSERAPANFGSFIYFAMRHWTDCRVVWVTSRPIDYPDMWLSDDAWEAVSSRFECAKRFRRRWPKPDVVSVCTSPDFIDARLGDRLLERVEDYRNSFRPKMPPNYRAGVDARFAAYSSARGVDTERLPRRGVCTAAIQPRAKRITAD